MRGMALGALAALLAGTLARPAPVPPARGPDTPEGRFAEELSLPPLGLYDASKSRVKRPAVSKDDLRLYPEPGGKATAILGHLRSAHLLLWATSPAEPPRGLAKEVVALRKKLKQAPSPLLTRIAAAESARKRPALERRLKEAGAQVAVAYARIEAVAELLEQVDTSEEPRRVKAWHMYLTAALLTRAVYLDEHQGALGAMRKEAPPLGADASAWGLRATEKLSDAQSRKRLKTAAGLWQRLIKEHPGTVWESLAREALKVPLGVQWQPVR